MGAASKHFFECRFEVKGAVGRAEKVGMTLGAALAGLWIWLGLVGAATAFGAWAACMIRFDKRPRTDVSDAQPVRTSTGPSFPRFSGLGTDYWARVPEAAFHPNLELVASIEVRRNAREVQSPTPIRRSA